jgi:hypothetical protein
MNCAIGRDTSGPYEKRGVNSDDFLPKDMFHSTIVGTTIATE